MTNTSITIDAATQLVFKFKAQAKGDVSADKGASEKFSADKRARLDARLARAYGTSVSLLGMEAADFGKFCRAQGTTAPADGENPFSACIRILFNGDKSAWKYGKCFRAAQSLGWTEADFVTQLNSYKLAITDKDGKEKKLGRLIALETLDTQNNGDPESDMAKMRSQAARRFMSKQEPLATFGAMQAFPAQTGYETGRMVGVVAEWDADAQVWHVRHVHQYEDASAWNLASKAALAAYDKFVIDANTVRELEKVATEAPEDADKLMDALNAHNSEVDALNDAPRPTRTVVHREDESGLFSYPEEFRVEQGENKPNEAQPVEQQNAAAK